MRSSIEEKVDRLNKAVLYLISKQIITAKSAQKDIASKMGLKVTTNINYALKGNEKYLTDTFLGRFNKAFNNIFFLDWLVKGEGEMLNEDQPKTELTSVPQEEKDKLRSQRFVEVLEELCISNQELKDKFKIDKILKSKIVNGIQNASIEKIAAICEEYENANPEYILTGRGTPLKEMQITQIYHPKGIEKKEEEGKVTLYDIEAAANLQHLFSNKRENILGEIKIPNIPACDGAVYVRGDSMYPLLKSGDIVAYKIIPLDIQHILFGEMYLVSLDMDGDEYLAVKYVNHSEKGEDWIKLVSYNSYHQPKDFPLSAVRAMALIKLSIRMNTMK